MADSSVKVTVDCYTDVLCIWAHVSQIRLDEAEQQFKSALLVRHHFITLFGDTQSRIGEGWKQKGGFDAFAGHVHNVASEFPHVMLHPDIWVSCRPQSSAPAHLFLKAVDRVIQTEESIQVELIDVIKKVRSAFFENARDIATRSELLAIAEALGLPIGRIEALINSGEAFALLCKDMSQKEQLKLEGSPTYVMNQGRQKLYGNVGYKILEANIQELLTTPDQNWASWC